MIFSPTIVQTPKNIINEHVTMIHWIVKSHLIGVMGIKTTKFTRFLKPK